MADVFISYHRSDGASALVRRIAGELESLGVSCWYDTKNTAPVDFVERIVTEINRCKVFLFLWDEESNKEPFYVRREIHTAATAGNVKLFPFRVGNFEMNPVLKFYFGIINILYGGDSSETAQIEELVKAIADVLGKPQNLPAVAQSQSATLTKIIKRGKCGDNVTYTLQSGVLTISGSGAMQDFKVDNRAKLHDTPWRNERKSISLVKIQNGVTTIGRGAFDECVGLTGINIPNSVTSIGNYTFWGCSGLTSISIPSSVTSIGNSAFQHCAGLTEINIPDSVTVIGNRAFEDCAGLRNVKIPKSVTSIGDSAFRACLKLTSIDISDSVTSIEYSTFRDCAELISATIPNGVTYIGKRAFENCRELASVIIPDSVNYIADWAFLYCGKLKRVSVPAKATIEDDAFPSHIHVTRRGEADNQ